MTALLLCLSQSVASWLPGSAVAVYGSLLAVAGFLLNATVLGGALTASGGVGGGGASTAVPAVRRLLAANLAVVHLAAAVLVVPAAVATEAVGGWTFGGRACRAWLTAQVLLIAAATWSVVLLDVDCLLRLAAAAPRGRRRRYAALAERHPRAVAAVGVAASWVVAVLAALPLALAVAAPAAADAAVLEEVCAVSLGRRRVIAQSLAAFLVPGAAALTGSAAILATRALLGGGSAAVAAASGACVVLWSPFFVVYAVVAFCGAGRLCVGPATWTLCAWLGHSSLAVAPAAWLIDPAMRSRARQFIRCCCCCCCRRGLHDDMTSSASSSEESCGLMSVAKYQIHRPAHPQRQQQPTCSPTGDKSTA